MMPIRICISVDVEEDLPGILRPQTVGIDTGLPKLLSLLDEMAISADFFFLSTVVRARPDLVNQISKLGHGVGNHGLDHRLLCAKSPRRQKEEILASTRLLEDVVVTKTRMFRAPAFSASAMTLKILSEQGYAIDSSILPGRVARRFGIIPVFDHRGASREPHHPIQLGADRDGRRLLEVPVTENPLRPGAPVGLGAVNAYGPGPLLATLQTAGVETVVFLIHPWELIDIRAYYPGIAAGYARACSDDLTALRQFLAKARAGATFSTLPAVAERLGRGNRS